MNWGKHRSMHISRLTFENLNFELWMNQENVCPNLSFTVKNKISHKETVVTFKLNINDRYIPFPKILRIYQ